MAIEKEPVRLEEGTRCLIVPEMYNQLGVQADHFVAEIPFELPELVGEGWRLADANVYINYLAPTGEAGAYLIEDLAAAENNTVTGTWILTQNATAVRGPLRYLVCAKWTDGEKLIAEWHSKIATSIVATGIEATEQIAERNADVIEQILARLGNPVQADWDQMDTTQPDYIKNRPFYNGITASDYLIATQVGSSGQGSPIMNDTGTLVVGEKYRLSRGATLARRLMWDGNTAGKVVIGEEPEQLVRISEAADIAPDDLKNCYVITDLERDPEELPPYFFVENADIDERSTDDFQMLRLSGLSLGGGTGSLIIIIVKQDLKNDPIYNTAVPKGIYTGAWYHSFVISPCEEETCMADLVNWAGVKHPGISFWYGDGNGEFSAWTSYYKSKDGTQLYQRVSFIGNGRSGFELRGSLRQIKLLPMDMVAIDKDQLKTDLAYSRKDLTDGDLIPFEADDKWYPTVPRSAENTRPSLEEKYQAGANSDGACVSLTAADAAAPKIIRIGRWTGLGLAGNDGNSSLPSSKRRVGFFSSNNYYSAAGTPITLFGIAEPEEDYEAANKKYVDEKVAQAGGGSDLSLGLTGATVGQIIKVKAVDAAGKPTEWEAAEAASGGEVKWHKIAETTTTEEIAEYVVNQDADGKAVKSYNPIALSLYFYIPADSTQASANGSPWIYPSASNSDVAIRCIGSISGWKTASRVCTEIFFGGENGIVGLGNTVAQVNPVGRENEMMDGIRIKINTAGDHFPVGTHFIVSALGVKP